jgi:TldD protein
MERTLLRSGIRVLAILFCIPLVALSSPPHPDVLLQTMQRELQRATASLAKSDPAPYFISYTVVDGDGMTIAGVNGSIVASTRVRRRQADVMMRVGSAALDNTHGQSRPSGIVSGPVPLRDDPDATAR